MSLTFLITFVMTMDNAMSLWVGYPIYSWWGNINDHRPHVPLWCPIISSSIVTSAEKWANSEHGRTLTIKDIQVAIPLRWTDLRGDTFQQHPLFFKPNRTRQSNLSPALELTMVPQPHHGDWTIAADVCITAAAARCGILGITTTDRMSFRSLVDYRSRILSARYKASEYLVCTNHNGILLPIVTAIYGL